MLPASTALKAASIFKFIWSISKSEEDPIPPKARDTLRQVRETGKPPPGYAGGRRFRNDPGENGVRALPAGGSYRDYDVDPKVQGVGRNAERIVLDEKTGRAWYTDDHYKTFTEIK